MQALKCAGLCAHVCLSCTENHEGSDSTLQDRLFGSTVSTVGIVGFVFFEFENHLAFCGGIV